MTQNQPEGFLAVPPSGTGSPVLVLHAWWGLNETIKNVCRWLAEAGFAAFAPDLYHGQIAATIEEAEVLGSALDNNHLQAKAEIAEAARYLNGRFGRPNQGIAVIGFSLGAYYALHLSNAEPELVESVVIFYGTGQDDFSSSRAAYLCHFAGDDPYELQENVDFLEDILHREGRPVTIYQYPGTGHWFFEPDRPDAYNKTAADLAWKRTLELLEQSFGS